MSIPIGLQSPSKRPRRNSSSVYDYFKVSDWKTHCLYKDCFTSYSLQTASTNLIRHLANEHNINLIDSATDVENENEDSSFKQSGPTNSKLSPQKQREIDDLFLKFLVHDFQAFHLTMSQPFRDFLQAAAPKYILPDEKTLKQRVVEKYETLKPKVENLVTESDSLKSWTSDGWSSNVLEPYLQLTTHFIDKNFKYYDLTFDFTLFPHPYDQFSSSEILFEVNLNFFI